MNPYYQYPNVIAPYLHPLLPWSTFSCAPYFGGWGSADPRNMAFMLPPTFPPTFTQPVQPGLDFTSNQQLPAMHPCVFSQMNAVPTAANPIMSPYEISQTNFGLVSANPVMSPSQFSQPPVSSTPSKSRLQFPQMNTPSQTYTTANSDMINAKSASIASTESSTGIRPNSHSLGIQKNTMDEGDNRRNITNIDDLMDANLAGTKYSSECTLILTEGKAAMSLAVAGLSVVGRDKYGLHALNRRLINVCKLPENEVKNNPDVKNIVEILGLRYDFKYDNDQEFNTLRYGKVMLLMDRDEDGSHMKGLVINFFYKFWPALLRMNRLLMEFISPVVKVWCPFTCSNEMFFYTVEDYENWQSKIDSSRTDMYATRHYRSLESFTPEEIKKLFSDLIQNCVYFRYEDLEDDAALMLAFEKDREDSRKKWISKTLRESFVHYEDLREIRYVDFINKELLFYSDLQNLRSFPSAIDGLSRSERKVLHAYFKRHHGREISVLRLMGSVLDVSAYKQSMESLSQTVINMAQHFVGTNNINILMPVGQFGTRMHGGKDAGKSKYLYTKLNPKVNNIFSELDFPILEYRKEGDLLIEPSHYLPIIPMILVNGAEGIGTGWKTKIPKYKLKDIIGNLFRMLAGLEPIPMVPYFKDFKGTVERIDDKQFNTYGAFSVLHGGREIRITELPIGVWTESYKEKVLNPMLDKAILRYEEYHTDTSVNFLVTLHEPISETRETLKLVRNMFQLKANEKSKFVAFDRKGLVRDFENPIEILKEYFGVRLSAYEKRKNYWQEKLKFNLNKLEDLHKTILYNGDTVIKCNLQNEKYDVLYDASRIQEKEIRILEEDIRKTKEQLEKLQQKSPEDIWQEELEKLSSQLTNDEETSSDLDLALNNLSLSN